MHSPETITRTQTDGQEKKRRRFAGVSTRFKAMPGTAAARQARISGH
jgi:hypothetical protein